MTTYQYVEIRKNGNGPQITINDKDPRNTADLIRECFEWTTMRNQQLIDNWLKCGRFKKKEHYIRFDFSDFSAIVTEYRPVDKRCVK